MKGSCSKPKSYKKATIDKILTVIGILAILFLIVLVLSFFLMLYLTINRFVSNYSLSEGFPVYQPCAQRLGVWPVWGCGTWDLSPAKKLTACRPAPVTHSSQIGYTPCYLLVVCPAMNQGAFKYTKLSVRQEVRSLKFIHQNFRWEAEHKSCMQPAEVLRQAQ